MNLNRFNAKILLFGEYSIICGSQGLSIPFSHFSGELSFTNTDNYTDVDFALTSNFHLRDYFLFLKELVKNGKSECDLQLQLLENDIEKGLFFESSIPQGYGVGSSGALVAAIYERYAENKIKQSRTIKNNEILELKKIFSAMEAYFHGTSSGIDPLNCYIKYPLHIINQANINIVGIPKSRGNNRAAIFLIDTKTTSKTEPLVNHFLKSCNSTDYKHFVETKLIPATNNCISLLLKGEHDAFYNSLYNLSLHQFHNFKRMIPEDFFHVWEKGLESGDFYCKLCGSGGGGFLLAFSANYPKAKDFFDEMKIQTIPVYRQEVISKG